ncbi:hypothetical protein ACVXZZ_00365 [Staphylococcus aureus]
MFKLESIKDLKDKISRITIGYTRDRKPVTVKIKSGRVNCNHFKRCN